MLESGSASIEIMLEVMATLRECRACLHIYMFVCMFMLDSDGTDVTSACMRESVHCTRAAAILALLLLSCVSHVCQIFSQISSKS